MVGGDVGGGGGGGDTEPCRDFGIAVVAVELEVGSVVPVQRAAEAIGEKFGIFEEYFERQATAVVVQRVALDNVLVDARSQADTIGRAVWREELCIDDERIAVPVTDRMTETPSLSTNGLLSAVCVNDALGIEPFVANDDSVIKNLDLVEIMRRRQAGYQVVSVADRIRIVTIVIIGIDRRLACLGQRNGHELGE